MEYKEIDFEQKMVIHYILTILQISVWILWAIGTVLLFLSVTFDFNEVLFLIGLCLIIIPLVGWIIINNFKMRWDDDEYIYIRYYKGSKEPKLIHLDKLPKSYRDEIKRNRIEGGFNGENL